MISARGVGRRWGGRDVLAGVDLEVAPGEVVGLVGPNGGGKSTLLLLLAGLVRPTAGSVTIGGVPAAQVALGATGTVGLVTAEPGLYPLLTGWENLWFFAGLAGLGREEVVGRAQPLLEALRVEEATLCTPVSGWSSGTRQKVSLVRALLLRPRCVLFDEPTSNLDPAAAQVVYAAVRQAADAGAAVVVATHDLHAAEHLCDRVVGVDRRVVAVRTLAGPRHPPPPSPLLTLFPAPGPGEPGPVAGRAFGPGVWGVARREWREQARQPGMLAAIGALFGGVAGVSTFGAVALDRLAAWPSGPELTATLLGATPEALVPSVLGAFDFLAATQLLGITAVAGGHALLHDRQCGTLVFLLLSPVRRGELLVGKVLGALGWPLVLHAALVGGAAVGLAALPIAQAAPELTLRNPAVAVALGLGAPAWAALLGATGAVLSGLARDVRAAQQGVWSVVFFVSLAAGGLLTWGLTAGVGAELAVAGLGAVGAGVGVRVGVVVLGRDLGR